MEPKAHVKGDMANRVVEGSVIAMLNMWKEIIPCTWMLGIVHEWNMKNHHVDHLYLSIYLRMK